MAPKGKKNVKKDVTWEHCTTLENRLHVKCNYCSQAMWGGAFRMKHHLAGTRQEVAACVQVPEDVKNFFMKMLQDREKKDDDVIELFEETASPIDGSQRKGVMDAFIVKGKGGSRQQTLNEMVKDRDMVVRDICRCIYGNALPFNLVKSPLFTQMVKSISEYGRGLKPPSYHEVRVSYLKKEVDEIHTNLDIYRSEWKKTGCTLMSDGWTDGKSRSLINFLVNSPRGTVFIKSIDTSKFIKDAEKMFELLDNMVDEIGEENIVQVVTDSASALVAAGNKLMEKRTHMFWTPCAAHCLDLILEDIGKIPVFYNTIGKAKKITVFIYRHTWVLNLYRTFSNGKELTRPAVTRFATSYLTLKSILDQKIALQSMLASEEWATSTYASGSDGVKVREIILEDSRFWKSLTYCCTCVSPLVKVLRLVDGDLKPSMGYIYEAMDRAKEQIAKNFQNVESRYKKVWELIDQRWEYQLHRPLHAAGYYLNPRFHYENSFNADLEVMTGLYTVMDKLAPNIETRVKIIAQLDKFNNAEGMFGYDLAIATRDKMQPAIWWSSFGAECKELQTFAIRVLSLTCSATGCERNWSVFEHIHSKKRNRLEQQRLNALVFVKYNLSLQSRQKKREEKGETYDPICLSDMESDDEWITEKEESCLMDLEQEEVDNSWMDVQECFNIDEGAPSKKRKRGPRNLNAVGKKDKGKKPIQVVEDDEGEDEDEEEEELVMVDDHTQVGDDFDGIGLDGEDN